LNGKMPLLANLIIFMRNAYGFETMIFGFNRILGFTSRTTRPDEIYAVSD
jgi:hypothetical protein